MDEHRAAAGLAHVTARPFVVGVEVIPQLAVSPEGPGVPVEDDGVEEPVGVPKVPGRRAHLLHGLVVKFLLTQHRHHFERVVAHPVIPLAQRINRHISSFTQRFGKDAFLGPPSRVGAAGVRGALG